jgi:hypothetical protein
MALARLLRQRVPAPPLHINAGSPGIAICAADPNSVAQLRPQACGAA